MKRPPARSGALLVLGGALLLAGAVSLQLGASGYGWRDLASADPTVQAILLDYRLPRIVLAALAGAALAGAGVAFQAVLRNPLADPYILGVSGGAALGAVLSSTLGGPWGAGPLVRPLAALAGAVALLGILFGLGRRVRTAGTPALLLVGVVLNAVASALILALVTTGDPGRFARELVYLVGALDRPPTWPVLGGLAGAVLLGTGCLLALGHRLNLVSLGEEAAFSLGIDPERVAWQAVIAASLVTACAVAFTGLIGFVGLIVPHTLRVLLGPDHRRLLPAAVLGGAAFLVLADAGARSVAAPLEVPVGVVTALAGGPFFLVLFVRRLRGSA